MKDWLLTSSIILVEASENGEFRQHVTLIAGGYLISGEVVSAKEYLQHSEFTKYLVKITDEALAEKTKATAQEAASNEARDPEYIHLKDARYFASGNQQPIPAKGPGVYARIRLDDVVGFHFGQLQTQQG